MVQNGVLSTVPFFTILICPPCWATKMRPSAAMSMPVGTDREVEITASWKPVGRDGDWAARGAAIKAGPRTRARRAAMRMANPSDDRDTRQATGVGGRVPILVFERTAFHVTLQNSLCVSQAGKCLS